jgi:hypothetical protein
MIDDFSRTAREGLRLESGDYRPDHLTETHDYTFYWQKHRSAILGIGDDTNYIYSIAL